MVTALLSASTQLFAATFTDPDEVLRLAYPDAVITRDSLLLTEPEKSRVAESSGQDLPRALVSRYVVKQGDETVAYAYLDKHKVRTLPETLMVVLNKVGVLQHLHVLAFREPLEYLPREGWYEQFAGKTDQDDIRMKKNIDGITGATLTARASTQCARRVMAVHAVLLERNP